MAATGAEFLRSIQTNAPGVAAVTESHPPVTGADGTANVALMTLAVPSAKHQAGPSPSVGSAPHGCHEPGAFCHRGTGSSLVRGGFGDGEVPTAARATPHASAGSDSSSAVAVGNHFGACPCFGAGFARALNGCRKFSTPSCSERCWAKWRVLKHLGLRPWSGIATQRRAGL
jgi:hypothetical protein